VKLTVRLDIFTALVYQVTQSAKAQSDELIIERVEFAEGWNVCQSATEELEVSLEGALRRNQLRDAVRGFRIADLKAIEPICNRLKWVAMWGFV
jgi:hypothetical protein